MAVKNREKKIRLLEEEVKRLSGRRPVRGGNTAIEKALTATLRDLARESALEIKCFKRKLRSMASAQQARSEGMAVTVHDLKVPITISLLNLELAEMESDTTEKENYFTSVRRELEFLLDTIGNLLELEQAEIGTTQNKFQEIFLPELVDGVIVRMKVVIKDKPDLALVNELPPDFPPIIGDRHKLIRVFNNLFSNAIKYTDSGSIRAGGTVDWKKKRTSVYVRDTGQGIEKDRLPELFRFFAGDAVRFESSGVGLAFVKQVIDNHKGQVRLESTRGEGTTVHLDFPLPNG